MQRIVTINAGGKRFQTFATTLLKFPGTAFSKMFLASDVSGSSRSLETKREVRNSRRRASSKKAKSRATAVAPPGPVGATAHSVAAPDSEYFVDVDPRVFEYVLNFLRTGAVSLPTNDEPLRNAIVHFLSTSGLYECAFPPISSGDDAAVAGENAEAGGDQVLSGAAVVSLPDVCVVQLCDHMQHDQGVKRHALTISYGADGFRLRMLAKRIRSDLNTQLASTYWQVYQTNERAAFFVTTKVANGTADLMTTSITQQVVGHTESMGYTLTNSYVTLSPDIVHTNVRMLIHNMIFRRVRHVHPDTGDALALVQAGGEGEVGGMPMELSAERSAGKGDTDDLDYVNPVFVPRSVGPQKINFEGAPSLVEESERVSLWRK